MKCARSQQRVRQSTMSGMSHDQENGGAQATQSAAYSYVQGLVRGQMQVQNGLASDLSAIQIPGINSSANGSSRSLLAGVANIAQIPVNHSWKDPQIYLSSAAKGKSASTHYDIVDFVSGGMEEEIIVGGTVAHQVVLKSRPRKYKTRKCDPGPVDHS